MSDISVVEIIHSELSRYVSAIYCQPFRVVGDAVSITVETDRRVLFNSVDRFDNRFDNCHVVQLSQTVVSPTSIAIRSGYNGGGGLEWQLEVPGDFEASILGGIHKCSTDMIEHIFDNYDQSQQHCRTDGLRRHLEYLEQLLLWLDCRYIKFNIAEGWYYTYRPQSVGIVGFLGRRIVRRRQYEDDDFVRRLGDEIRGYNQSH